MCLHLFTYNQKWAWQPACQSLKCQPLIILAPSSQWCNLFRHKKTAPRITQSSFVQIWQWYLRDVWAINFDLQWSNHWKFLKSGIQREDIWSPQVSGQRCLKISPMWAMDGQTQTNKTWSIDHITRKLWLNLSAQYRRSLCSAGHAGLWSQGRWLHKKTDKAKAHHCLIHCTTERECECLFKVMSLYDT